MVHFQFIAMAYSLEILNNSFKIYIFYFKSYTDKNGKTTNNDDILCQTIYCKSNHSGTVCYTGGSSVSGI
jgi:hypothetical protein